MILEIKEIEDPGEKSAICADITAQLPMWFGRPESNAKYLREITERSSVCRAGWRHGARLDRARVPLRRNLQCVVARCQPGHALIWRRTRVDRSRGPGSSGARLLAAGG